VIHSYKIYTNPIFSVLIICTLAFILSECTNNNSSLREEEIERKEAELRAKELDLREQTVKLDEDRLKAKAEKSMPELYNEVKSGVVLILTQHNEEVSQGSAFIVNNNGLAISNYHVFENASDAIAINENGDRMMITEIYDYSKEDDYIIFRIGSTTNLPFVNLADELPPIGEACFAVGNPQGLTQTFSSGHISSYRNNLIQTTTEITYGSSGGPLFNKEGKVIGITSGGIGDANINFAISINSIPIKKYLNFNYTHPINTEVSNIEQSPEEATLSIVDDSKSDLISGYYQAIETENWDKLSTYYAPQLKRYFDEFNITRDEAINIAQNYKKDLGINETHTSIRWNSFKAEFLNNGNQLVEYIIDYKITSSNNQKTKVYVLNIILELTSENKIESIYENIINSY